MSSQLPATVSSTGISKSAAKKRAKKAAKAHSSSHQSSVVTGDALLDPAAAHLLDPSTLDPNSPYSFPPGSFTEAEYDSSAYYEDTDLPPLPSGAGNTSFANYAFGDRNQVNGSPFGGLSQSINITHEDLLETANELWKRMGETAYGEDDPYWSSLPPHVRQFIREAIPFNGLNNTSSDPQATQKDLYAMAQRIVHAASQGMGLQGVGSNLLSQVNGRPHLQPTLAEDLGFHRHPDAVVRPDDEYEDEEDYEDEPEGYVQPNGDAPKKKNKKKKKKPASSLEPPPTVLPPVKLPPRQPVPLPPTHQPIIQPPTPVASQPIPSSRAAGKQPMTHAPTPAPNAPARSARAAGKAPVTTTANQHAHHPHTHLPAAAKSSGKSKAAVATPPAKVWTTASIEERENITQFWLSLTEAERRDLLQIEKDAVLRRMKEQQRHSCACAVCGRKKVNIEMELDQLYEQYYDELERYTQHQRAAVANLDCPPPPGAGPFPGSVELDPTGQLLKLDHLAPSSTQPLPLDESDEYEDEEEYDDEEELEDEELASDEAEMDYPARKPATKVLAPKADGSDDFYGFGANLATIKGIITVADDMLKNDGSKFLEMMEQLAVKRVAREHLNALELREETDDEDDDISESQRMEDGRRMFAIFAARMFEQRVLQAYRERIAKEREEQLLRELEMEEDTKRAREEKKAKEAQKKKDKKRMQKQRQDEEKAAREASIAEEQRAIKIKAEEAERERLKRQEEERQRREAAKRAAQEEATRRETERRKRQEEERAREEEAARKKREREDKIKKEREARELEAKEKERKDREDKERLAKERAERERTVKEARERAEKERLAKQEEERLERQRRDESARRERELAEQRKILAAQQAAREKAAAEKAAAEQEALVAAEKAARDSIIAAATVATPVVRVPTSNSIPVRTMSASGAVPSLSNSIPQHVPPASLNLSPPGPAAKPVAIALNSRPTQKTPQTFFPQPLPTMSSYNSRTAASSSYGQPYGRPSYPSQSPVFSPPQANGGALLTASPSTQSRGYASTPDQIAPFEQPLRPSLVNMFTGKPNVPGPAGSGRSSLEDAFRVSSSGSLAQRAPLMADLPQPPSLFTPEEFRHMDPSPIGAPIAPPGPIGSRPTFDQSVGGLAALPPPPGPSASARIASPAQPEQVFGSAALGADDEIVQPARRLISNGWQSGTVPGTGRWSAAPGSIWGSNDAPSWTTQNMGTPAPSLNPGLGSSIGLPGGINPPVAPGMPPIGERPAPPSLVSSGRRQTSFGSAALGPTGGFNPNYSQSLFAPPQPQHGNHH